jgi:hypothetical protein
MATTWLQFKTAARQRKFPQLEASNLVAAHDKAFTDAMSDLQQWVPCLQQNNTQIVQQCETYFNCGLTAFDAPRGKIQRLSVIDKINQKTGGEDATLPSDYCSEIVYLQIDPCYIQKYISKARGGCCSDIGAFFALPSSGKTRFPPPTDSGMTGLSPLPLGYHYGQTSTDARRRSSHGVWAIERGQITVAPWIQSTETIILKWDGIKRTWNDNDVIDDDPLLARAVEQYVLADHASRFDRDYAAAQQHAAQYNDARSVLIRQCDEETEIRNCQPSQARSSTVSINSASLYYNDTQGQFTASCPNGTTGDPATQTVLVGTVASNVSVADANQKAQALAQSQAESSLNCLSNSASFTNDAQTATATCIGESGAPPPTGTSASATVAAGSVTSNISKEDANKTARDQALAEAQAQITCTWYNSPQTYTALCAANHAHDQTVNIPSGAYSSTISQVNADDLAFNAAKLAADNLLAIACVTTPVFHNTPQYAIPSTMSCPYFVRQGQILLRIACQVTVLVNINSNAFTGSTQDEANTNAYNYGRALGFQRVQQMCAAHDCGTALINYP